MVLPICPYPSRKFYFRPSWLSSGKLPRRFVVWDCETTGLSPDKDVVTQIAFALFEDGKIVKEFSRVLDWTREPRCDIRTLLKRLQYTREQMEKDVFADRTGVNFDFDYERLRQGDPVKDVLRWAEDVLRQSEKEKSGVLVGHNLFFDARMFSSCLQNFAYREEGYRLPATQVIDTASVVKSLWSSSPVFLRPQDSCLDYLQRTQRSRAALHEDYPNCKLQTCAEVLDLPVDVNKMHEEALEDCKAAGFLLHQAMPFIALANPEEQKGFFS